MSVTRRFDGLLLAVIVGLTLLMIAATKETSLAEGPEAPTQLEQSSQDVPADITSRGICEEPSYRLISEKIQYQLTRNFRPDDVNGLRDRLKELRELFSKYLPPSCTRRLYAQLGPKATSDKLSKLFHYRLATATRTELLKRLENRFPPPPAGGYIRVPPPHTDGPEGGTRRR